MTNERVKDCVVDQILKVGQEMENVIGAYRARRFNAELTDSEAIVHQIIARQALVNLARDIDAGVVALR